MDRFRKQLAYEAEGAAAAVEGKTRGDCPYQDTASDGWNYWVYGNENAQADMIRKFMVGEGTSLLYMSTAPLTPETKKQLQEWGEKCADANQRMRQERGWSIIKPST